MKPRQAETRSGLLPRFGLQWRTCTLKQFTRSQMATGRIGRALSEVVLSQELGSPVLLSLSSVIQKRRKEYYRELNLASYGSLDITRWVEWFVDAVLQAQLEAREMILFVLAKARFWEKHETDLNERQTRVVKRMMQEGPEGFTGGMSARKYTTMTGCSKSSCDT